MTVPSVKAASTRGLILKAWLMAVALLGIALPSPSLATIEVSIRQGSVNDSLTAHTSARIGATPNRPGGGDSSGGRVDAQANEIYGILRAYADTPLGWGSTSARARIYDRGTFFVAGERPVTVIFYGFLSGTAEHFGGSGDSFARGELRLRVDDEFARGLVPTNGACGGENLVFCAPGTGAGVTGRVSLPFELPPGTSRIRLEGNLLANAVQNASANFSNSAYLWLDLPENVTYTPSFDGFLSLASPVPEPKSAAMLLAGLAAVLLFTRVRGSKRLIWPDGRSISEHGVA
jgi:hypothetical protein